MPQNIKIWKFYKTWVFFIIINIFVKLIIYSKNVLRAGVGTLPVTCKCWAWERRGEEGKEGKKWFYGSAWCIKSTFFLFVVIAMYIYLRDWLPLRKRIRNRTSRATTSTSRGKVSNDPDKIKISWLWNSVTLNDPRFSVWNCNISIEDLV